MAISPIAAAQMSIRRRNFQGRTDKYLSARAAPSDVITAVQKELGFLDFVTDSGAYNELYRESAVERLNRYKRHMRFYEGKHFENEYDDGEKKVVFNFCKAISDKASDFFSGKAFTLCSNTGNDDIALALDAVWSANNKGALLRKVAQMAGITGDAYVYITIQNSDLNGNLLPEKEWKLVMVPLDPFFVFPLFAPNSPNKELASCLIQFPTDKSANDGSVSYRTLFITPEKFVEQQDNAVISQGANPFGMVNVVHIPNFDDPTSNFGQSDITSVISLNEEYNSVASAIRKIIKYHAEPTTVIFGARASKLEKGAKKVWSGLPVEARVENLSFNADLNATYAYLNLLEEQIYKVGNTPGVLFKPDRAMSHTSAAAMKMLYEPLLELTDRKTQSFNVSNRLINEIILRGFAFLKLEGAPTDLHEIKELAADITAAFPDPLPYDENAQLDLDTKKLDKGIVSLSAVVRKYNPTADLSRLTSELIADAFYRIAVKREEANALQGQRPDIRAFLLSSATSLLVEADRAELNKLEKPEEDTPDDLEEDTKEAKGVEKPAE